MFRLYYFENLALRCFYFQCILVVFAIIAVSNAIPIDFGHYAAPIYAPVAKAIVPEPIVSVFELISCMRDYFFNSADLNLEIFQLNEMENTQSFF